MRVLGSSLFILFKAESKNPLQVSACFQLIAQYSHLTTENCMCGRITSGDNVHLLQMWQNLIRTAVRQKYKGEDLCTLQSTTLRFQDQFHTYFTILPLKKFSKANVQKWDEKKGISLQYGIYFPYDKWERKENSRTLYHLAWFAWIAYKTVFHCSQYRWQ